MTGLGAQPPLSAPSWGGAPHWAEPSPVQPGHPLTPLVWGRALLGFGCPQSPSAAQWEQHWGKGWQQHGGSTVITGLGWGSINIAAIKAIKAL